MQMAKSKKTTATVVINKETRMSCDDWNQCCCIISNYADQMNTEYFCNLNLADKDLDDLKDHIVYTAKMGTRVVGFLVGSVDMFGGKVYAEADWLFLDYDLHRNGVGGKLLNNFEEYVKNKRNAFGVGVKALKTARGFYEKKGYRASEEQDGKIFMNKHFDRR